jgi:hypothetical protein
MTLAWPAAAGPLSPTGLAPAQPVALSPAAQAAPLSSTPLIGKPAPLPVSGAAASLSPSALADKPAALPTPSPVPMQAPTPSPGGPGTPGMVSGAFTVLTRSGQAPAPVMSLRWPAAEPGDYLIRGYRLLRSEAAKDSWTQRPPATGDKAPGPLGLNAEDPVQIGTTYEYVVEAIDVKGRVGPRSAPFHVDLRSLPEDQVAPRPPQGLSAIGQRETVKLEWQASPAWVEPVSGYRVFRGESWAALAQSAALTEVAGTSYEDTPTVKAKDFVYALRTVDVGGRASALSLSVSARATGPLPPGSPVGLTTHAKVEKVSLAWSPASPGTSPVTAYLLRRREEASDVWKTVAYLPASASAHTDSVSGDRGYVYSLAAVDAEGLTGTAAYAGASPTAKIWNKTLVILMPTAYANNKGYDSGLNLNVLFDFYVGSLYESYTNPATSFNKTGLFQPLQIGTVTGDFKWSLLDDRGLIPGLAAGVYTAALIPFGSPGGGQSVGVSSAGNGISTLGNVYGVFSKRFWPGEPRAAIHVGLMYGKLADYLTSDPSPKDWRPTLRHLAPGGDVPMMLNRFADPKLGALVAQAPHMAFAGLQMPFTVPLLFTTWRTGIRLEAMVPLPESAEYPANILSNQGHTAEELLPVMTNIHIDNLPLFGFEFSLFQYLGGYQVIAFYHIPDLTWSW